MEQSVFFSEKYEKKVKLLIDCIRGLLTTLESDFKSIEI